MSTVRVEETFSSDPSAGWSPDGPIETRLTVLCSAASGLQRVDFLSGPSGFSLTHSAVVETEAD